MMKLEDVPIGTKFRVGTAIWQKVDTDHPEVKELLECVPVCLGQRMWSILLKAPSSSKRDRLKVNKVFYWGSPCPEVEVLTFSEAMKRVEEE